MLCARCQHFAAVPGATLCAQCAVAPPPPAPPFAAPPAAWLRSPVGLGRAAAWVLGLVVAVDLFAVWADLTMLDVAGDLADGTYGPGIRERADDADTLYGLAGLAQLTVLIASAVVFLCWFHRVRVNAEVFAPFGHAKRRGWAIGAWFTPVVNFWYPRRITLDIWDASSPWGPPRSHALINVWWTLWLVSLVTSRAAYSQGQEAESPTDLHDSARQMLFADAVDIVAAVLAILVVVRLTRMQHLKALAGPLPTDPAPTAP
ncbi:DUF4328 domain-containing protein [Streptomyces sp. NPDC026672]|uniref:DUF4328 domain-containing protein n=1 Tax=unclassified Streptomyces TaxID=2593676 RepID=UPI003407E3C2